MICKDGYLNIMKERGMTSHDVVFKARKILATKKIGHTGTLDPEAEGVLVLCVGKATKLVEYITDLDKVYEAEIIFGKETDSCDLSGQVVRTSKSIVTKTAFQAACMQMTGKIKQRPPIYSAIKINGRKLYEYARAGIEVEIPERDVEIKEIKIKTFDAFKQSALIEVRCSKGTYIRSLCRDLGCALSSAAVMGKLLRKEVGDFSLNEALTLDDAKVLMAQNKLLLKPLEYGLEDLKKATASVQGERFMANGNKLIARNIRESFSDYEENELIRLYIKGTFIGVGKFIKADEEMYIKPVKLL
ncbi:tRNA pseudouridine(55) synthase TruB [Eubacteriaceae bacterium ES2]|nr:tRNA pseudouridine(55) synthase TruB [Eubacteriaceae bacterium ES2]